MTITPAIIERRLKELSGEVDEVQQELIVAEEVYTTTKAKYEISMARSRMNKSHPDFKLTAVQREDQALLDNAELHMELAIAEAKVKAARANASKIKTQVDIARSISVSVRASMEL